MAANTSRSTAKRSTASTKSASQKRSGGAKRSTGSKSAASKNGARATRSTSGGAKTTKSAKRSTPARSSGNRSAASRSSRSATSQNGSSGRNGVVDTVKQVAGKAAGPAIGVGAAAVGLAGGIVLKNRSRRKTVLGVPLPRSIGTGGRGLDGKSLAKAVGQASKQFAKTTKSVSKDLERAGDQAERIGKILD